MSTLRTLTYVVKMDTGDAKIKSKDFRVTLKTMEQDANKASVEIDKLAKSIGAKYGANVTTAIDNTKTVKNEFNSATREASRTARNYASLVREYTHLAARSGKTAEAQEKMNALHRLGANATLSERKEVVRLVSAYQEKRKAATQTQGSMRALRGQAQNLGYQLQDVAVQAQAGTDALVILGQQGSQLAAGFGAKGALIGAGIAVIAMLAALAVKVSGAGKDIKDFTIDVDEAAKSLDNLNKLGVAQLSATYLATFKRLGSLNKQYLEQEKVVENINWRLQIQDKLRKDNNKESRHLILSQKELNKLRTKQIEEKATLESINKAISDQLNLQNKINKLRRGDDDTDDTLKWLESQKKRLASNRELVDSLKERAAVTALTSEELLEYNKQKDIELLRSREGTKAQEKAIALYYDEIKVKLRDAEETKRAARESAKAKTDAERKATAEIAKSLRTQAQMQQDHINTLAKYTDTGKLIKLQIQYAKERDLLKGNQEALIELEKSYNEERLLISGSFFEKYAVSAKRSLGSFDEQVISSLNNFNRGFGQAFGDAIFESNSLGEAMENIFKGAGKSMVAYFGEFIAQRLTAWALEKTIGTSSQGAAVQSTTGNAVSLVNMAALAAYQSAAAVPGVGYLLAPGAAASAYAATAPMASAAISAALAAIPTFDKGGRIPSGGAGIVAEYGDELVGGTMIYNGSPNSLNVTGREETARKVGGSKMNNYITVNSSGDASPEAIARALVRALKRGGKQLDNSVYGSMVRGKRNRGLT